MSARPVGVRRPGNSSSGAASATSGHSAYSNGRSLEAEAVVPISVGAPLIGTTASASKLRPLLYAEWPLVALAAPLLLFPGRLTPTGLALIGAPWIVQIGRASCRER